MVSWAHLDVGGHACVSRRPHPQRWVAEQAVWEQEETDINDMERKLDRQLDAMERQRVGVSQVRTPAPLTNLTPHQSAYAAYHRGPVSSVNTLRTLPWLISALTRLGGISEMAQALPRASSLATSSQICVTLLA